MSRTDKLFSIKPSAALLSWVLLLTPILSVGCYAVDQGTTHPVAHRKARKKAAPPLVLPPLPAGPLSQVPMDQMPAAAPKVTYENGLLSIGAQNATLGDILREVHRLTGASIDIPPAGANDRVVVQLGPGAPRDVLATLLNGTSFNYVLLGSASSPTSIASVTLTSRPTAGGGVVQTAVNTAPMEAPTPFQQMQAQRQGVPPMAGRPSFRNGPALVGEQGQQPQPVVAADDESDDSDNADDKDDDSDQGQQQQVAPMVQPGMGAQPDNSQDQGQPNAGPKTPEQILQMIRDGQRPGPPGIQPPNQQPQD